MLVALPIAVLGMRHEDGGPGRRPRTRSRTGRPGTTWPSRRVQHSSGLATAIILLRSSRWLSEADAAYDSLDDSTSRAGSEFIRRPRAHRHVPEHGAGVIGVAEAHGRLRVRGPVPHVPVIDAPGRISQVTGCNQCDRTSPGVPQVPRSKGSRSPVLEGRAGHVVVSAVLGLLHPLHDRGRRPPNQRSQVVAVSTVPLPVAYQARQPGDSRRRSTPNWGWVIPGGGWPSR